MRRAPQCTAASELKNLSTASKNERNESPTASGMVTPSTLIRARAREAEQHAERLRRARPQLVHDRRADVAEERSQRQDDQDRVVELAGHRDEVRHEVERKRQVAAEQDQGYFR